MNEVFFPSDTLSQCKDLMGSEFLLKNANDKLGLMTEANHINTNGTNFQFIQ